MCSVFASCDHHIAIIMPQIARSPTLPLLTTLKCTAGSNHTFLIKTPITAKQIILHGNSVNQVSGTDETAGLLRSQGSPMVPLLSIISVAYVLEV